MDGVGIEDAIKGSNGLDSVHSDDSDFETTQRRIFLKYNAVVHMDVSPFEKWLKFKNAYEFRKAVCSHSIKHGAPLIKFTKNENRLVSAKCFNNCSWRIYASKMYNEDSMQVKGSSYMWQDMEGKQEL